MQDQHPQTTRSLPVKVIAGLSAVVLLAGGGAAWLGWRSLNTNSEVPADITQQSSEAAPITQEQTAEAYVLEIDGTGFELVPTVIEVPAGQTEEAVLTATFEGLLSATNLKTGVSEIPAGTELLSLAIENDGVYVNLSEEFTQGGGSASMMGRLGQVIYTASGLDSDAPIWISVEGEPLEVLGGEGLIISQPMTRSEFDADFSL